MSTPIVLTPYERELVLNAEILHAKNSIIKKVYQLFAEVSNNYMEEAAKLFTSEATATAPKISRGEQYLGLPYVMLDYPRNFARGNTFAIRTFFWWGHFFSIHLQLSGEHQQMHAPAIIKAIKNGHFNGWFLGVHENEWHHHFDPDNYQTITDGGINIDLTKSAFIKLAKKIPLAEWDGVQKILTVSFIELINLTGN